jgi:hypothetical protein
MPHDSDAPVSWSFEPAGRLVHLRWAIAELAIELDTPNSGLDAAERALNLFALRALALVQSLERESSEHVADAACAAELGIAQVRAELRRTHDLRPERARALHAARRKLHHYLMLVAEALAMHGGRELPLPRRQRPELRSMLTLRQLFSAFRAGLISAGEQRFRLRWALEVAAAELGVLTAHPALSMLPLGHRARIGELHGRIVAWLASDLEPLLGRALYRELSTLPSLGSELSAHPLLAEHDDIALAELSVLLAKETLRERQQPRLLSLLSALRGLDPELDRLELNLVYGARGAVAALGVRVSDLRSRLASGAALHRAAC